MEKRWGLLEITESNFGLSYLTRVPKVLGEELAPKFLGTKKYISGRATVLSRDIYTFPKREPCLMAMSYSYELQAKVFDQIKVMCEVCHLRPCAILRIL